MSETLLLETLKGSAARRQLMQLLGRGDDSVCVYYLCPLTNLYGIAKNGILPHRTAPKERVDLSAQTVQARREIEITLNDWSTTDIHNCINLFWNPVNWTCRAFQRNAVLVRAKTKRPSDGVLAILEINLEYLFANFPCKWTIAPQNAAAGFTNFSADYFKGESKWEDGTPRCDWESIFSFGPTFDGRLNAKRSAELIMFRDDTASGAQSLSLPFDCVERIIVPDESIWTPDEREREFLSSTSKVIFPAAKKGDDQIFLKEIELLKYEKAFVDSLLGRRKSDSTVGAKLNEALKAIAQFGNDYPALCPIAENFIDIRNVNGHHGTLHSVRVMLWAAFLAQHLDSTERNNIMLALLVASSLHDTHRLHDFEDHQHGASAAAAHSEKIFQLLPDVEIAKSCLNAIIFHSRPDDECETKDRIWAILKDADALDRGRFGNPKLEGGCNRDYFRTEILRQGDPYNNIAWMAHQAAQITKHTSVGNSPCQEFSGGFCLALNHFIKTNNKPK